MKRPLLALNIGLLLLVGVLFLSNTAHAPSKQRLDDSAIVRQYIREHIATLAPEDPVLGGSWYLVDFSIEPATQSGTFVYEDGHIQGTASFLYTIEDANRVIVRDVQKVE